MRAGTENVAGIAGLGKAIEMAYDELDEMRGYITSLKTHMTQRLKNELPGVKFNGDTENGLYTVLSVALPDDGKGNLILFNLDIQGIAASGGSACSSGTDVGSHVIKAIGAHPGTNTVRFSFSKYNTLEEVDFVVEKVKEMYLVEA